MCLAQEAWIILLLIEKVIIVVKYLDITIFFQKKSPIEVSKYWNINIHIINSEIDKKLVESLIYNLRLVKLETFKTYFKTNLANNLILSFKSFVTIFILFVRELDSIFCLCINYKSINNLIIKNCYLLLPIVNYLIN